MSERDFAMRAGERGERAAHDRRAAAAGLGRLVVAIAVLAALGGRGVAAGEADGAGGEAPHAVVAAVDVRGTAPVEAAPVTIAFPVIRAAGALERRGKAFGLAGVAVTSPDETCGEGADAWPCGRMALTAVRRFVRTRTISCLPAPDGANCTVGGEDIAKWLVSQGWARADGPAYGEAEEAARKEGLGLWSPVRPMMAKRALSGAISEADAAEATVVVEVDLSDQRLTLIHRGAVVASWPVSTARAGKITPTGRWRAQWLSRHHRSSIYNNAPMPYSVFFNGDYAIHGTNDIGRLGRPASAGCIRLHPRHAAVVFDLARREGPEHTLVVVRR